MMPDSDELGADDLVDYPAAPDDVYDRYHSELEARRQEEDRQRSQQQEEEDPPPPPRKPTPLTRELLDKVRPPSPYDPD